METPGVNTMSWTSVKFREDLSLYNNYGISPNDEGVQVTN